MKKKILIVGYGNIGMHIEQELHDAGDVWIVDPKKGLCADNNVHYDFAFVCVPTDMLHDGSCDYSIVENVVSTVNAEIVIIKSTIPVGCSHLLASKYDRRLVFSPEYYGTTIHAPKSPDFVILAGNKSDCDEVAELYYRVKGAHFHVKYTDYKTAELAKYMENCFLALKVTFCAEFATIAKDFGISYPELRELFVMDERMGDSHTYVHSDQPYYDSHCLNKDIPALIKQTNKAHLMEAVQSINTHKKKDIAY